MKQELGKLERVENLREIWPTEDGDFTPWLAKEENLKLLSETIDMELELEAQEKNVGPFRADILCKNTDDGSWVLIENQLERTDHTHLGQLLTYGAGLDAINIVWIASKFTGEHRAALDWQNTITDKNFKFFGLEIEAWKIGDSLAAPKFNIISQPNDWSKSVSREAQKISEGVTTEIQAIQLLYWQNLMQYLEDTGSKLRRQKPFHWQAHRFSLGKGGIGIVAKINIRENKIRVEVDLWHKDYSKAFFHLLMKDKEAIERELGADFNLDWQELPDQISSKIDVYKDADPTDETDLEAQQAWFKNTIEAFDRVFRKRVKKLDPNDWNPPAPK